MTEEEAIEFYSFGAEPGIIYVRHGGRASKPINLAQAKELNICYDCGIAPGEKRRYRNCEYCLSTGKQSIAEKLAKNKAFK